MRADKNIFFQLENCFGLVAEAGDALAIGPAQLHHPNHHLEQYFNIRYLELKFYISMIANTSEL